jgi:hypothetical protein
MRKQEDVNVNVNTKKKFIMTPKLPPQISTDNIYIKMSDGEK